MIYTEITKKALSLCYHAHKDQVDAGGTPYVFHLLQVAEHMNGEIEVCAALLQDIVTKTDITIDDLSLQFPGYLVKIIEILTPDENMSYFDYLDKIKEHPIARRVKYFSLRHNLDTSRYGEQTPQIVAQLERYRKALDILTDYERTPPAGALPEVMPCPYCGEEWGKARLEIDNWEHYVECPTCLAVGPTCLSSEEAVNGWNNAYKSKDEKCPLRYL